MCRSSSLNQISDKLFLKKKIYCTFLFISVWNPLSVHFESCIHICFYLAHSRTHTLALRSVSLWRGLLCPADVVLVCVPVVQYDRCWERRASPVHAAAKSKGFIHLELFSSTRTWMWKNDDRQMSFFSFPGSDSEVEPYWTVPAWAPICFHEAPETAGSARVWEWMREDFSDTAVVDPYSLVKPPSLYPVKPSPVKTAAARFTLRVCLFLYLSHTQATFHSYRHLEAFKNKNKLDPWFSHSGKATCSLVSFLDPVFIGMFVRITIKRLCPALNLAWPVACWFLDFFKRSK